MSRVIAFQIGYEQLTESPAARVAANLHVPRLAEEDIHRLSEMDQGARGRTVDLGLSWGVELY